ncbi:uncharacterized protein LOC106172195 isoform X2 [Lingula anatina]|uniref:Uncharacterized protein LOC106172195 isoform X2 n=1 Tax=Lingula anatina TaxID=7574 RepID=A0A1S3JCZ3_LINAN|nr:uncharacterized protein LOC106172195 isoform X2 [Lingula anatina]|eukprot:XP_013408285.1 uncharacterized protein LOC106172195 isoform X2 [Lingula anatina]
MSAPSDFKLAPVNPKDRPRPFPPRWLKGQKYQDVAEFHEIDEHAIRVSQTNHKNFKDLVWHLVFNQRMSELEAVRAIFRWMTSKNLHTVQFDKEPKNSPEEIVCGFRSKKSTYARIFETLCLYSGIHCVTLTGFAKGVDYRPGVKFAGGPYNHSWNAVYVDGSWQLVDSHWATRYLQSEKNSPENLVYEYDDFYFLTNPEQLIYSHWPEEQPWQLLPRPLSLPEFEDLPLAKSHFFKCGMQFWSHNTGTILTERGKLTLTLGFRSPTAFTYKLVFGENNKEVYQGIKLNRYVLQETLENQVNHYLRAPLEGSYYLTIYAQKVSNEINVENVFNAACEYKVICDRPADDSTPYPQTSDTNWGPGAPVRSLGLRPSHKEGVIQAINGRAELRFAKTRPVRLLAKLQKNGEDEGQLDEYIQHHETENQSTFNLELPQKGEYALEIYANDPEKDDSTYTHICQYVVEYSADSSDQQNYGTLTLKKGYRQSPARGADVKYKEGYQSLPRGSHTEVREGYGSMPRKSQSGQDVREGYATMPANMKGRRYDPQQDGVPLPGLNDQLNKEVVGRSHLTQEEFSRYEDSFRSPTSKTEYYGAGTPEQYGYSDKQAGRAGPGIVQYQRDQYAGDSAGRGPAGYDQRRAPEQYDSYGRPITTTTTTTTVFTDRYRPDSAGRPMRGDEMTEKVTLSKSQEELAAQRAANEEQIQAEKRKAPQTLPKPTKGKPGTEDFPPPPPEAFVIRGDEELPPPPPPLPAEYGKVQDVTVTTPGQQQYVIGADGQRHPVKIEFVTGETQRGVQAQPAPAPKGTPVKIEYVKEFSPNVPRQQGKLGETPDGKKSPPVTGYQQWKSDFPPPPPPERSDSKGSPKKDAYNVTVLHEFKTPEGIGQPVAPASFQPVRIETRVKPPSPAPPPTPLKEEVFTDRTMAFKTIDRHAMEVSQKEHKSFRDMVWALIYSKGITDDLNKARAIFLWLCTKDLSKMHFEHVAPDTPEEILMGLKEGKATYAVIYETLCSYAGLHCKVISGYAKGADYKPGMKFTGDTAHHSWNAVLIDGHWRLVDCHWAARRMIGKKGAENVRYGLDEYYFMIDQRQLIYTHFPDDPNWQLLERQYTLEEFENLPPVKSLFFKYGLDLLSHKNAVIYTDDEVAVQVGFSLYRGPGLEFHCSLAFEDGREEIRDTKLSRFILQETGDRFASFKIRVPDQGSYKFVIYAKEVGGEDAEKMYSAVCEYQIVCLSTPIDPTPFPPCSAPTWGLSHGAAKKYGVVTNQMAATVGTTNGQAEIRFKLEKPLLFMAKMKSNDFDEKDLDGTVMHRVVNDTAIFSISVPQQGEYGLEIFANEPAKDGKTLFHMCQYFVVCNESKVSGVRYPQLPAAYLGPQPGYTNLKMNTISHKDPLIVNHTGELEVEFSLSQPMRVTSNLIETANGHEHPDNILQQQQNNSLTFNLRLPHPGVYKFQIYAQSLTEPSENLPGVYNYLINCDNVSRVPVTPYPRQFAQWKEGCYLYEPQDGKLSSQRLGANVQHNYLFFKLEVPKARMVAVVVGEEWEQLEPKQTGTWEGGVYMDKFWGKATRLAVTANYGGSTSSYNTLLEFSLH